MSKVLICSGGHKHVMSPSRACQTISKGLCMAYPNIQTTLLPMADGGDGTIDALVHAYHGEVVSVKVRDPLFRQRDAVIGCYQDTKGVITGVIEIAEAAGSALLSPFERQTMVATSYGVGELLLYARDRGCQRIIVGLGGSIVSDMGLGMAQALGIIFFDAKGKKLSPLPGGGLNALSLTSVADFSLPSAESLFSDTKIIVASDANISLLGSQGQARVFGPQKGASSCEIEYLEAGFANLSEVIHKKTGRDVDIAYAGAAGGLGAGLCGFLGARMSPGAALIAEAIGLDKMITEHDLVITGEGLHDSTTCLEKTPYYVAKRCRAFSRHVLGVVGAVADGASADFYDALFSCDLKFQEEMAADFAMQELERISSCIDINFAD